MCNLEKICVYAMLLGVLMVGVFIFPWGMNNLYVHGFISGTLCIERGLGNTLTCSMQFLI